MYYKKGVIFACVLVVKRCKYTLKTENRQFFLWFSTLRNILRCLSNIMRFDITNCVLHGKDLFNFLYCPRYHIHGNGNSWYMAVSGNNGHLLRHGFSCN